MLVFTNYKIRTNFFSLLALQYRTNFTVIRIYFDTPTFDKITKDKKVKFVDMLSAIGGTMGLLTGFSIISGVEILYYIFHIFFDLFHSK